HSAHRLQLRRVPGRLRAPRDSGPLASRDAQDGGAHGRTGVKVKIGSASVRFISHVSRPIIIGSQWEL
ncbi:hypothetical protein GDO81_018653, partial [Engystomops pustulosus]